MLHTPVQSPEEAFLALIVRRAIVSDQTVARARRAAVSSNDRVDRVLVKLGLLDEKDFVSAWADILALDRIGRDAYPEEPILPHLLRGRFLRDAEIVPLAAEGDWLSVAVFDPLNAFGVKAIEGRTGRAVRPKLSLRSELREALDRLYPVSNSGGSGETDASNVAINDVTRLKDLATDAPAIQFVNVIVERAIELRSSDIHLSMGRTGPRLRYRVDGALKDEPAPPTQSYSEIISRVKVLAELDISERRLPQDGRIRIGAAGREIDLRVATMPHAEGEGLVLRLLDRSAVRPDLHGLGLPEDVCRSIDRLLAEPYGMFLVTGPTGSGKTTTLYAALQRIVSPERNVISVEDPIEYQIDGVVQIQVQRKIGLDFPTVLRAALRQDPDTIMIGEIRDSETASIANQAALTGHFVLATLHTNSASAAVPRLIDMGLEPYLLSSTIRGVLAQRLIRLLCSCATPATADQRSLIRRRLTDVFPAVDPALPLDRIRMPVGCEQCNGTGYRGRAAIAEILVVDEQIRDATLERADAATLEAIARRSGTVPLWQSGVTKIADGQTSVAEVLRVAGEGTVQ